MTFDDFSQLFFNNAPIALAVGTGIFGLTLALCRYLTSDETKALKKLLTGQTKHKDWSQSFIVFFDVLFGKSYISIQAIFVSSAVSMLAVISVWAIIGGADYEQRLGFDLTLSTALTVALTINLIADFISLAETRFVLKNMHRFERFRWQILVLAGDFLASLAIIGAAIWVHRYFQPDVAGDDSISEILGAFSLYSVMLYSTFVTSVWSWIFMIGTWIAKVTSKPRIRRRLKVRQEPILTLALANAIVSGFLYYAGAVVTETGDGRVSLLDRGVCLLFRDQTCLNVARLSSFEEEEISFILIACENGLSRECVSRGLNIYRDHPDVAVRYWRSGCNAKNGVACANLGYMYDTGLGLDPDPDRAHALREEGCLLKSAFACRQAAISYRKGLTGQIDMGLALDRYKKACDLDDADSCGWAGSILVGEQLGWPNPHDAAVWLDRGCMNGDSWSCERLGRLYEDGELGPPNPRKAKAKFERGCELEDGSACGYLADLYEDGELGNSNSGLALEMFEKGCGFEDGWSCARQAELIRSGAGPRQDEDAAIKQIIDLINQSCDLGSGYGCRKQAELYERGDLLLADPDKAIDLYLENCETRNDSWSCYEIGLHFSERTESITARLAAIPFFEKACELKESYGCIRAAEILEEDLTRPVFGPITSDLIEQVYAKFWLYESKNAIYPAEFDSKSVVRFYDAAERLCIYSDGHDCRYANEFSPVRTPEFASFFEQNSNMFNSACDSGSGWACHMSALYLMKQNAPGTQFEDARLMLEKACLSGSIGACTSTAKLAHAGHDLSADFPMSIIDLYIHSCQHGDAEACFAATEILRDTAPEASRFLAAEACDLDYGLSSTFCSPYYR